MPDLTKEEQQRVRAALHYLRRCVGGWKPLADALHYSPDSLEKIANARGRTFVTPKLAFRTARFVDVGIDDLLGGRFRPGACPRCGYLPDPETDPTHAEDTPDFEQNIHLVK
jgi:hypothetical protein